MRRVRILLLLLLPALAGSLWALPSCEPAAACHMGPDGESCCPPGECSMQECQRQDPAAAFVSLPSHPPVSSVAVARPKPAGEPAASIALAPPSPPRDVPV